MVAENVEMAFVVSVIAATWIVLIYSLARAFEVLPELFE